MKSTTHNLSFSCEENRVDYQYIPENYYMSNCLAENLNLHVGGGSGSGSGSGGGSVNTQNKNIKNNTVQNVHENSNNVNNTITMNNNNNNNNFNQLYQRSLSSSFLNLPQLQPLLFNSSLSLEYECACQCQFQECRQCQQFQQADNGSGNYNIRKKQSEKSQLKNQNITKIEFGSNYNYNYNQPFSIGQLGLDCLISSHKISTKNVLRNFGNAQSQYMLHNEQIQEYIQQSISNKKEFQAWIRKLKLLNFVDYKDVWTISDDDSKKVKIFKKLYKKLCWKFYEEECIPYIFNSRLTLENKKSHLLQIYKMLRGITNPSTFEGFKD